MLHLVLNYILSPVYGRMQGDIITFGKKAATIQTKTKDQFYAPFENMDDLLLVHLDTAMPIRVTFDIDDSLCSGHSNNKPRYYAKNVQLQDMVLF